MNFAAVGRHLQESVPFTSRLRPLVFVFTKVEFPHCLHHKLRGFRAPIVGKRVFGVPVASLWLFRETMIHVFLCTIKFRPAVG